MLTDQTVPIQGHGIDGTHRSCNMSAQVRRTPACACYTCNPETGSSLGADTQVRQRHLESAACEGGRLAVFFLRPIGTVSSGPQSVAFASEGPMDDIDAGYDLPHLD